MGTVARWGLGRRKGYLWVTLGIFLVTLTAHWAAAWVAYQEEQREHDAPVDAGDYAVETFRDTMENWQSEFLQLMWQVAGLSFLFYVGSPQSREASSRVEAKIDHILERVDPEEGSGVREKLDTEFPRE